MTPQKFCRFIEAMEVVDDEDRLAEVIEWCGGERALRPGYLIALKTWTATTMLAKAGDWVAFDKHGARVVYAYEMEQWEPA